MILNNQDLWCSAAELLPRQLHLLLLFIARLLAARLRSLPCTFEGNFRTFPTFAYRSSLLLMPLAYFTRKARFAAAHRYWRPEWSAEQNSRVFGACANPHGHGHNYLLEVTVAAEIDPQTGFSADIVELDRVLDTEVRAVFDHQHINHAVPEFRDGGLIPTTENIAVYCWPRILHALPAGMKLQRLRLHEDETFYVDYFGGGKPSE